MRDRRDVWKNTRSPGFRSLPLTGMPTNACWPLVLGKSMPSLEKTILTKPEQSNPLRLLSPPQRYLLPRKFIALSTAETVFAGAIAELKKLVSTSGMPTILSETVLGTKL